MQEQETENIKSEASEELNYRKAYLYIFNQTTDIIKRLTAIQRKAESICIDGVSPEEAELEPLDVAGLLKAIADYVKLNANL